MKIIGNITFCLMSYWNLSYFKKRNLLSRKFPETWILPIAVLFAIGAYVVLAIVFYNNDG